MPRFKRFEKNSKPLTIGPDVKLLKPKTEAADGRWSKQMKTTFNLIRTGKRLYHHCDTRTVYCSHDNWRPSNPRHASGPYAYFNVCVCVCVIVCVLLWST